MSNCIVIVNGVCVTAEGTATPLSQVPENSHMVTFIVWGSIAAYIFLGAFIGRLFYLLYAKKHLDDIDDSFATAFVAALWPIAALSVPALLFANRIADTEGREKRAKIKHEREVELLRAESERNESALRLLERNGINARVSGF